MEDGEAVLLGTAGVWPDVPATISLTTNGYTVKPRSHIEKSRQQSSRRSGTNTVITVSGHPPDTVQDYLPRVLWGLDKRGMLFTLLDAKMEVHLTLEHVYTGCVVLHGVHIRDGQVPVSGVRVSFPLAEPPGWLSQVPANSDVGELAPWVVGDGRAGIQWRPQAHRSLHRMMVRDTEPLRALLSLWTGQPVRLERRLEVELPGKGWHMLDNLSVQPQMPALTTSHLLPLSQLTLEVLARWVHLASRLGPLPYMALRPTRVLQPDAHNIAAGLEGIHRRLMPGRTRLGSGGKLEGVDEDLLASARRAAVDAAVYALGDAAERLVEVRQVFEGALSRVHEPSYKDRMMELLPQVKDVAPGLLGPDVKRWIRDMEAIRNIQAHQLPKHDDFGEEEISLYYVLEASGRWVMRILLLLQVASPADVSRALRRSSQFQHSLANMDREQHWRNFSTFDTFTHSHGATAP